MTDPQLLILCAAWARDGGDDSVRTMQWYRDVLDRFPEADKILAFNHGSDAAAHGVLFGASRVVETCLVAPDLHIDSDAAPYQAALRAARPRLRDYDAVLFMQTKGASYAHDGLAGYRAYILSQFFDNPLLVPSLAGGERLVCPRAQMDTYAGSIAQAQAYGAWIRTPSVFSFGATYTNFAVTTPTLIELVERAPPGMLEHPITGWGGNRFFFEGTVPSMLVTLGADLGVIGDRSLNPDLNPDVGYDCDPGHTSAIALREYARFRALGAAYQQRPLPYLLGALDAVRQTAIAFAA